MNMKEAVGIVLKEMGLEEIPPASSPIRKEFAHRVLRVMRPDDKIPRISKLEDFS